MKPATARWLRRCAVLLVCAQIGALAQNPAPATPVQDIRIQHIGPAAVSDDLVRANIRIKKGDSYNPNSVEEDIRNLYGTGYFFNIRVGTENSAQGVVLTYVVQSKPIITEVRLVGNKKYSVAKLKKKITSKVGEPIDERKLFTDAEEIRKMYEKAGLQRTTVKYSPSINEALGRGTVTFDISESPKIRIDNVRFEGVKDVKQSKLRRVIKTRRWWWMSWLTSSGKFKEDQFEEDKEKLTEFYADRGYIDYELKDVRLQPTKTNHVVVNLQIEQGSRYQVGAVDFKGNELFSKDEIIANLRSKDGEKIKSGLQDKPGAIFTPRKLNKDTEAILDFYGARGYIDSRVDSEKIPNVQTGSLDLMYHVKEGEKSYIEKIEIKGNAKTKDKVIRRELAITPGQVFDQVRVKISKSRLDQLQYFEKVEPSNEPTDAGGNRKNLIINVEEKNTGNFAVGAGFSSVDSIVGYVEISQGNFDLFHPPNFTGGGQKARIRIQQGSLRSDYIMSFVEPWFLGRRLALSTELYHRRLNYFSDNYEQKQTGFHVGLSKQLPFHIRRDDVFVAGLTYTLEDIGLKLTDTYKTLYPTSVILDEEGTRLASRLGASLAYDSRNSSTFATKGQRIEFAPEVTGGPLSGDVNFYRLEFKVAQYWNPGRIFSETSRWQDFFEGHVLEMVGRVGVVNPFGDGDRGRRNRVPLFDRDYLGGLYSLRGYKFRAVGPKDPVSSEPIGGGTYWFAGAEYSVPIIERLRFALFYDAGMVYEAPFSFSPQHFVSKSNVQTDTGIYNDNVGIGLRLNLPIGPLRLDYGIPLTRDVRVGSGGRFQFGVGYQRDF